MIYPLDGFDQLRPGLMIMGCFALSFQIEMKIIQEFFIISCKSHDQIHSFQIESFRGLVMRCEDFFWRRKSETALKTSPQRTRSCWGACFCLIFLVHTVSTRPPKLSAIGVDSPPFMRILKWISVLCKNFLQLYSVCLVTKTYCRLIGVLIK